MIGIVNCILELMQKKSDSSDNNTKKITGGSKGKNKNKKSNKTNNKTKRSNLRHKTIKNHKK